MSSTLYISIPYTFENKVLEIKSLGYKAKGEIPDQALLECIKNTSLYIPLMLSKFVSFTDYRGREVSHLEVPFHQDILKKLNQVEPYPVDAKKKSRLLSEPSPEELLNYAYPNPIS